MGQSNGAHHYVFMVIYCVYMHITHSQYTSFPLTRITRDRFLCIIMMVLLTRYISNPEVTTQFL